MFSVKCKLCAFVNIYCTRIQYARSRKQFQHARNSSVQGMYVDILLLKKMHTNFLFFEPCMYACMYPERNKQWKEKQVTPKKCYLVQSTIQPNS